MTEPKTRLAKPATRKSTPACDNHPGREAKFQTSSGGKHQLLSLCEQCVPKHWRSA